MAVAKDIMERKVRFKEIRRIKEDFAMVELYELRIYSL
jgi:hypothetical protein